MTPWGKILSRESYQREQIWLLLWRWLCIYFILELLHFPTKLPQNKTNSWPFNFFPLVSYNRCLLLFYWWHFRNANLSNFWVDLSHAFRRNKNITHHKPWGEMRVTFQNCAQTCFCRKKGKKIGRVFLCNKETNKQMKAYFYGKC